MTTETITNAQVGTVPAAVVAAAAPSKAKKANAIFAEMFAMSPVPARKDMIARAVKEAGLTDSGAATYLQNYKTKHGLVQPRQVTAPVAAPQVAAEPVAQAGTEPAMA